jgi:hypothetical protein
MAAMLTDASPSDHDREPDDTGDPSQVGVWEPIRYRFKSLPVHVALLHTGKVLALGGSCNDRDHLRQPYPATLWDPRTGELNPVEQDLAGDVFCAGHTFLSDGRLLVAGGTYGYDVQRFGAFPLPPFSGLEHAYLFDPIGEMWTRVGNMLAGRWYPTLVTMGDGRVLCVAGFTKRFPWVFLRKIEVYSPGEGWRKLQDADRWMPLYPRLHLLPAGGVFYAGSYNTHYTFPFALWGFPTAILNPKTGRWTDIGLPRTSEREEGTTVLLPLTPPDYRARILLTGGGTPGGDEAVPDAEIIDLSEPGPRWRPIAPMKHARYYAYPVILPDRQILVVGGRSGAKGHHSPDMPPAMDPHPREEEPAPQDPPQDPLAVREGEMFDPDSEQWRPVASMQVDRLYHSNALLLPDGRVMVAGSNPASKVNELRIEIYRPPYLFQGSRPRIEDAPPAVIYGDEFEIRTPDAPQVDEVALIRPSSTTHCVNTDQRYVGMPITGRTSESLRAQIPDNPNLAPPGYYMLFILRDGIPSEARFMRVGG